MTASIGVAAFSAATTLNIGASNTSASTITIRNSSYSNNITLNGGSINCGYASLSPMTSLTTISAFTSTTSLLIGTGSQSSQTVQIGGTGSVLQINSKSIGGTGSFACWYLINGTKK